MRSDRLSRLRPSWCRASIALQAYLGQAAVGSAVPTVEMLKTQLTERDQQLRQAREQAGAAEGALLAGRATEPWAAGRRSLEAQCQLLRDRNIALEAQLQCVAWLVGLTEAGRTVSVPIIQPQVSAGDATSDQITSAFIAELISLEQFIRSSAHSGLPVYAQSAGRVPMAAAPMVENCRRAVVELVQELRGAKGQLHELRLANDLSSNRANGLDASKAELHQELVEACRRLSELHNRVTLLEVENATVLSRCRELEEKDRENSAELESRRKFVQEVCSQLIAAERSVRDVSKNASWSPVLVHRELAADACWNSVKVALSEQATGCAVAMQACARGLTGMEEKFSDATLALDRAQQDAKAAVMRAEEQAEARVMVFQEGEAQARERLQAEQGRRLQEAEEQANSRIKAAEAAEMAKIADFQRMLEEMDHANGALRMQLEDARIEISHHHERMVGFERCNGENARLVQALESRSKELEDAIGTMIAPSKHAALEKELQEMSGKLTTLGEEKEAAAHELESLLGVIRELRFKLQEGDEGNKALEKENMKLCWQHVEWKTQLGTMQEAIRKRDQRLMDTEGESEQRKAELMQVVSRSKAAQGDLKALQELVETIEAQRQSDARNHLRVVTDLQRKNEELQQREAAMRVTRRDCLVLIGGWQAHLEQLDAQLQRSRHLSLSGDTSRAVAGVSAVADELSGRLSKMRSTSPHRIGGIASSVDRAFDRIDTNRDGVISRDEWSRAMQPPSSGI